MFVDVLRHVQPPTPADDSPKPMLRPILDILASALPASDAGGSKTMVVLDDITSLEWIGFSTLDVVRFCRALRSACLKVQHLPHYKSFRGVDQSILEQLK